MFQRSNNLQQKQLLQLCGEWRRWARLVDSFSDTVYRLTLGILFAVESSSLRSRR